ncbi:unnamed protein product [Cochlearia groenlandica]
MSTYGKSIALVSKQQRAQTSDFEDQVSLIVKKYFKEMERGQQKFNTYGFRPAEKTEGEQDAEDIINMVGYLGIAEEGSESDLEEESGLSVEEENQVLVKSMLKFQDENKGL